MADDNEAIEPIEIAEEIVPAKALNAYSVIILDIFNRYYTPGATDFEFTRQDIADSALGQGSKSRRTLGT